MKSLSRDPWTAAHQAPPSMGFSRQEYWSGVSLPSPSLTKGRFKLKDKKKNKLKDKEDTNRMGKMES